MAGIYVGSVADADRLLDQIRASAGRVHQWIAAQSDPLDLLRRMKFETAGFHPIDDRPLNVIEQTTRLGHMRSPLLRRGDYSSSILTLEAFSSRLVLTPLSSWTS